MNARWKKLESLPQLDELLTRSHRTPQIIFKHSTRCIISKMVLAELDDNLGLIPPHVDILYLDLLIHRGVSDAIAMQLGVHHESPQIVVIKNGRAVFHESHHSIHATAIAENC